MTPLLSLLLILPYLTLSPLVSAGATHGHTHLRGRSKGFHNNILHVDRSIAASAPVSRSLEARLAKRAAGRVLASRAAAGTVCRAKGSKFSATSTTSSVTSSSSTTATTSSSVAVTVAAAAVTSPVTQSQTNAAATASATAGSGGGGGSTSSNIAYGSYTPNGIKAGIAGGDAFPWLQNHIGWWYDWSPAPTGWSGSPVAVSMLWGGGTADATDAARLAEFEALNWNPPYIIGFEEPDCPSGSGSAGMDVGTAAALWNQWMVPHGQGGSLLLSPSMCHQAAESGWLQPFESQVSRPWDITNIHINKNSAQGISDDIDHYWNTYGKPIWVTEFACVDDSTGFVPCEDQGEINSFIYTAVGMFESDSRIAGYAYSNGYGLGTNWPLTNNGQLSASGQTYLAAISQYH